ncbi:MAG: hypothetical protein J6X18_06570 [Bacteroidales bacterium]|nr:hypothetical protein [Bacteroidales bacterium]
MEVNIPKQEIELLDYYPTDIEWKAYIKPNASAILKFMQDGYQYSGNGDFATFTLPDSIWRTCSMVRIAFCGREWVAIALYTSRYGGFKSIGITATTNKYYREEGKEAVKEIIKRNIYDYKLNFWTECSGVIEHYYIQNNGINIPAVFAKTVHEDTNSTSFKGIIDEYHYYFQNSHMQEPVIKTMFGFSSKELFDRVYKEYASEIDKRIKIIEQMQVKKLNKNELSKPDYHFDFVMATCRVMYFNDLATEGLREYPEKQLSNFLNDLNTMETLFDKVSMTEEQRKRRQTILEDGKYFASVSVPMTLHQFKF